MKKKSFILFIFVLSLFAAVQFVFADAFPGNIAGSTADANTAKGNVTVTNVTAGATLTLYSAIDNTSLQSLTPTGTQTPAVFSNLDPGKYYVKSATSDASPVVDVKPPASSLQVSSTAGSSEIDITGGISGATFTLHNDDPNFVPMKTTAGVNGNGKFTDVPVGKNYRVTQTINGVESALSTGSIDILPNKVTVVPSAGAGSTNDQGTITVTGGKAGNTLNLYNKNDSSSPIKSITLTSTDRYIFTNLPAGTYYVTQIQSGLSSLQSDDAVIGDEQAPVLTLKGEQVVRVTYGDSYQDAGVDVTDNTDANPQVTTVGLGNITSTTSPGTYTISYSAKDSNGNASAILTRTVIISPKTVTITEKRDTHNASTPDKAYGDITINDVMSGATLYLYRVNSNGSTDTLIRTISAATAGEMTIQNVPVGTGYYIIQKVNNIKSDPSEKTDILDTTNPNLTLNGKSTINLIVGNRYTEQGASATDNIDAANQLNIIIGGDTVDTNKPGIYKVTYNVSDQSNNQAIQLTRTVIVRPQAVAATGSTADIGTITVSQITPGDPDHPVTLTLYKVDGNGNPTASVTLTGGETNYVFKKYAPGFYYVTQTINSAESDPSNTIEVIDIDRPHITLNGPEQLSLVWKESKSPYYDGNANKFSDPGATAKDYLDGDLTTKINTQLTKPDGSIDHSISSNTKRDITFTEPGTYVITYSVTANRGAMADVKNRIITIAPPSIPGTAVVSTPGKSTIQVSNIYPHSTTVVNLYNTYDQLIQTKRVNGATSAVFGDVPAGIGYYVTQTVNGFESAPSDPVNVSPYSDANSDNVIGISSFTFNSGQTIGSIDQVNRKITATVPYGTDVTSLKAAFTCIQGNETVQVNGMTQTSSLTAQDFTKPVVYTVISAKDPNVKKNYTVTVQTADTFTSTWSNSVKKNINLVEGQPQAFALTPTDKEAAAEKGMSFIANNLAIHVPSANIQESSNPLLTINQLKPGSFITPTDPVWKNDLTNMIEIGWDGNTKSFLQPIEVEIPNANHQTFVRLVREDGKLYAIIQPQQDFGNRSVGLATMPGTYAFLSNQAVLANVTKTGSEYTLSANWSNATIYYTTVGKDIAFDRSARNSSVENYMFNGKISELNNWNKYENKAITGLGNNLYAVAMHNQVVSLVSTPETAPAEQWYSNVQTVTRSKVWSVTFNSAVNQKALYSNVIYVTDDGTGDKVPTFLQLSADGKTISIVPKEAYQSNHQYTLWIEKPIQGASKEFLRQAKKLTFIAK